MAKRFHFDDEFDEFDNGFQKQDSQEEFDDFFDNDINTKTKKRKKIKTKPQPSQTQQTTQKKKKIKGWQIALIVFAVLIIGFFGYIFILTNNDGPVYGDRCEGITTINVDAKDATIKTIKDKYSSIEDLTIEVVCKEVKIDIVFKDKMNTSKAKKIAEETAKTLDDNVGLDKEGKTYSSLFGYIDNVAQYDCQLYLVSNDSSDFPIYGTKHHSKDSFSYTYASVKDEKSKNKAEATLK
jgi:flagellar basal body-associated protein FliL